MTMTRRVVPQISRKTFASISFLFSVADRFSGIVASPRASAVADPAGVELSTASTVDPGGAFLTMTFCAEARPGPVITWSAAASASGRQHFLMLVPSVKTQLTIMA
jgi:hypothetical protein